MARRMKKISAPSRPITGSVHIRYAVAVRLAETGCSGPHMVHSLCRGRRRGGTPPLLALPRPPVPSHSLDNLPAYRTSTLFQSQANVEGGQVHNAPLLVDDMLQVRNTALIGC